MKFISLKEIKYEAFANFLEGYVFSVASYGTHIKCIFEKKNSSKIIQTGVLSECVRSDI